MLQWKDLIENRSIYTLKSSLSASSRQYSISYKLLKMLTTIVKIAPYPRFLLSYIVL